MTATLLPGKTTTVKLEDLAEYLDREGLEIIKPIYYQWINGVHTPILTVRKKSLAGQGETQNVHRSAKNAERLA